MTRAILCLIPPYSLANGVANFSKGWTLQAEYSMTSESTPAAEFRHPRHRPQPGGAIAQIVSHAYGFDGATIDPGAAGRIVETNEYIAATQAMGLTSPGAPATFKNWLVAGSTVSGTTGPHVGDSSYLPSLQFSGEQALKSFLLTLINPAVGVAYMVGVDQFSNKHASEQISEALGIVASGQTGGGLPAGSITLALKVSGYDDPDPFTGQQSPRYSQSEFDIKDASGTVLSSVRFSGQGIDRKMEIYDTTGTLKTTVGASTDGKTITTATDTNHDGSVDQNVVITASPDTGGQLAMTVERDIAGHRVTVEFVENASGDLTASRVASEVVNFSIFAVTHWHSGRIHPVSG